jgi:hypothetical protein
MSDEELKRVWKEAFMDKSRYYPSISGDAVKRSRKISVRITSVPV